MSQLIRVGSVSNTSDWTSQTKRWWWTLATDPRITAPATWPGLEIRSTRWLHCSFPNQERKFRTVARFQNLTSTTPITTTHSTGWTSMEPNRTRWSSYQSVSDGWWIASYAIYMLLSDNDEFCPRHYTACSNYGCIHLDLVCESVVQCKNKSQIFCTFGM